MGVDDAAVIEASLVEPAAFATLFDRHATTLFRFLVRRVDPSDADALLGDVFRIAFERRATFDLGRPSARPWLYGIATNVVARHRRGEARRWRATQAYAGRGRLTADPADDAVTAVDAHREWTLVAGALEQVPDGEREALLLFAWEELGYDEIAVVLDIPIGTVRSRLNRARRRLRSLTDNHSPHGASAGGTS